MLAVPAAPVTLAFRMDGIGLTHSLNLVVPVFSALHLRKSNILWGWTRVRVLAFQMSVVVPLTRPQ